MHSKKLLSLPLAVLTLSACGTGETTSESKIINGSLAPDGGVIEQSTVGLATSDGQIFCTGTLIHQQFVVSAGHCLADFGGTLYIAFGRDSSEFQYIQASDHAVNAAYTGNFDKDVPADISVIALSQPAPTGYAPVEIYKGSLPGGSNVALAGFGQTQSGSSGSLHYTIASVRGQSSNEFEVYEDGTGSCYGDSGGPGYVLSGGKLKVIGADSRGQADCQGPSVYTNVAYHLDWLRSLTGVSL